MFELSRFMTKWRGRKYWKGFSHQGRQSQKVASKERKEIELTTVN